MLQALILPWQALVASLTLNKQFLKTGCRLLNLLDMSKGHHHNFYSQWLNNNPTFDIRKSSGNSM